MTRIGIIGSENSHALAFSQIINTTQAHPDMRVVGIYGEDAEASRNVYETCGLEFIARDATEMLGRIDAVMVTSRDGSLHADYARPYIDAGLPIFIDKPITNEGAQTVEILRYAQARGVPLAGGSSVKHATDTQTLQRAAQKARADGTLSGGHVWAPIKMDSPYGGFYFYASHLIETAMMIFGYDALRVHAIEKQTNICVTLEYADFAIPLTYTTVANLYGGTVLTTSEIVSHRIVLAGCYEIEVAHFAHMVRTGEAPQPLEELALPVIAMNAIRRAYETGVPQDIIMPDA